MELQMAKKGYWIAHVNITDPERYKDYVAANAAPLKKYGARFLVRNGENMSPEDQLGGRRHVVIEFDSYADRQGLPRLTRVPGGRRRSATRPARPISSSSRATRAESRPG